MASIARLNFIIFAALGSSARRYWTGSRGGRRRIDASLCRGSPSYGCQILDPSGRTHADILSREKVGAVRAQSWVPSHQLLESGAGPVRDGTAGVAALDVVCGACRGNAERLADPDVGAIGINIVDRNQRPRRDAVFLCNGLAGITTHHAVFDSGQTEGGGGRCVPGNGKPTWLGDVGGESRHRRGIRQRACALNRAPHRCQRRIVVRVRRALHVLEERDHAAGAQLGFGKIRPIRIGCRAIEEGRDYICSQLVEPLA